MHRALLSALVLCLSASVRAEDWQRIVCIDDPRLTVTLLVKPDASPADEDFVGWELNNRTDAPLKVSNASYALDDVLKSDRDTGRGLTRGNMASGSRYDLLFRDGKPVREPRDYSLPPGVTRRMRYASVYSLAITGFPREGAWTLKGTAQFEITLADGQSLSTPKEGVPFQFNLLAADAKAIEAMSSQLKRVLANPTDPFADASALSTLFGVSEVASTLDVNTLLEGLQRTDQVVRPKIVQYINAHFPSEDATIDFWIDAARRNDYVLMSDLVNAPTVRSPRLVEPLIACIEAGQHHAPHFALRMLRYQWPILQDRNAVAQRVGPVMLQRMPLIAKGELPGDDKLFTWMNDIDNLALTGDPAMAKYIAAYLDRIEVVVDARRIANVNNGVSTRACDHAYNALLVLLDRPDQRFSIDSDIVAPRRPDGQIDVNVSPRERRRNDVKNEYTRRDKLIVDLKAELTTGRDK